MHSLGHTLTEFAFDYDPYNRHLDPAIPEHVEFTLRNRPRFGAELLRQVKTIHAQKQIDLFFSYFWVATQFQPQQIAEDLKKYGGYVPGVRPGKPTADFLDFTMTRLTFAGAVFLTIIAILPQMLSVEG